MPPVRKVDLLPEEIRDWLESELKARGFGDYEAISTALNGKLEAAGLELRIQKSAIHAFGAEFRDYARQESAAAAEIRVFLEEASMGEEVKVTRALYQQLTTLQFKLQKQMAMADELPDPRGMKDLTTALNNLIRSTSLRAQIIKDEHKAQSEKLTAAVASGDIDAEAAAKARRIMGFSE